MAHCASVIRENFSFSKIFFDVEILTVVETLDRAEERDIRLLAGWIGKAVGR